MLEQMGTMPSLGTTDAFASARFHQIGRGRQAETVAWLLEPPAAAPPKWYAQARKRLHQPGGDPRVSPLGGSGGVGPHQCVGQAACVKDGASSGRASDHSNSTVARAVRPVTGPSPLVSSQGKGRCAPTVEAQQRNAIERGVPELC